MAAMDFPATPTVGQLYPNPMTVGVPQYKWDGVAWITVVAPEMIDFVKRAGDTMTGFLTLSDNPTSDLHAVPKQYVDGGVAGISGKVSKAGDVMSGNLDITKDEPRLNLKKTLGNGNYLFGYQGGIPHWAISLGNTATYTGTGNAGSNFTVLRYDDAGSNLGTALEINRATGNATFSGVVTASGDIQTYRAASPGTGLLQFTSGLGKYIYYDGANFNFAGGGIVTSGQVFTSMINSVGSTLNFNVDSSQKVGISTTGSVVINGATGAGATLFCGGTPAAYTVDFRAISNPGASLISWCVNTTQYGMSGAIQGGTYYSFYGSTSAYIAAGSWGVSDGRLKSVTEDANPTAALAAVNALAVKKYIPSTPAAREILTGKDATKSPRGTDEDETLYGWEAQDVEQIIPIAVRDVGIPKEDLTTRAAVKRIAVPEKESDEATTLGKEDITVKAINDRYMLTTLWSAVQRLSAQNDELRAEIEALKAAG